MHHALQLHVTNESGAPVVRFTIAGKSSVLGVVDVETMIAQLARIRASMQPAHPAAPPASEYPMEFDPCWRVDVPAQFDGVVLSLRHLGVGWTAFALPPSSLAKLAATLAKLSGAEEPSVRTMLN